MRDFLGAGPLAAGSTEASPRVGDGTVGNVSGTTNLSPCSDNGRDCWWRTHSCVQRRHSWRRLCILCNQRQRHERGTIPGGNVSGATNHCGKRRRVGRLKIGRRMKSCPTTDVGPPVLSTACGEVCGKCRHGTQECVRHWNPRPSDWAGQKVCGARYVPVRDRRSLLAAPLDGESSECRQECRHGTQECVRHWNPRPSDWAGQKVATEAFPPGIVPRFAGTQYFRDPEASARVPTRHA